MSPVLRLSKSEAEKLLKLSAVTAENEIALKGLFRFWEYPLVSYQTYYTLYHGKEFEAILAFLTSILKDNELEKVESYLLQLVCESSIYFQQEKNKEIENLKQQIGDMQKQQQENSDKVERIFRYVSAEELQRLHKKAHRQAAEMNETNAI